MEPLEKKVIVRKKPEQRIAQQAAMIKPEKLVRDVNSKDEDSVERTVRKIRKLIISYYKEKQRPLDFFKLILPPDGFGRTVRNMLYISFLVKDGVVTVRKGIFFFILLESTVNFFSSYENLDNDYFYYQIIMEISSCSHVANQTICRDKILEQEFRISFP